MALLLDQPVALPHHVDKTLGVNASDSGFAATDDYATTADPIALRSELTSVTSHIDKASITHNTELDDFERDATEGDVIIKVSGDDGAVSNIGNPLAVSFAEVGGDIDDEKLHARFQEATRSLHFVSPRIKSSWLDNTYQKALARARARLAKGHWPQTAEEWRLPNAPLPARPDFTRTGPVDSLRPGYRTSKRKERRKRSETFPRSLSETKTFSKQPVLPHIDTLYDSLFANLAETFPAHLLRTRWESSSGSTRVPSLVDGSRIGGGRGGSGQTYLPFTGSASLHPKELSKTVRLDDTAPPPKLCNGCASELGRAGEFKGALIYLDTSNDTEYDADLQPDVETARLISDHGGTDPHLPIGRACEACHLSNVPHIHVTKPRRVGGGFVMIDRAVAQHGKDGASPAPLSDYISAWEEEERRQEERRRQLEEARQRRLEEQARQKEEELERRKTLYQAPKAFEVKKTEKKTTESSDPFTTDRTLHVPKGEGFQIKKSEKQATKFIETTRRETEWKEPKKFEPKKTETRTTRSDWKPPERPERLRPETPPPPPPPPKGKKPTVPIEPKKREQPPKPVKSVQEKTMKVVKRVPPRDPTPPPPTPPPPPRDPTPPPPKPPTPPPPKDRPPEPPVKQRAPPKPEPKKKPKQGKKTRYAKLPKRERKVVKKLGVAKPMPERKPPSDEWVMPNIGSMVPELPMPAFPLQQPVSSLHPPPLPEIPVPEPAPEPADEPTPEKRKFPIKAQPPAAIIWRRRPEYKPKKRRRWRKTEAGSAPTSPEPEMRDPLDYLAKYCIVFKERIPHYQRIFNNHLRSNGVEVEDRTLRHWMSTGKTRQDEPVRTASKGSGTSEGLGDDAGSDTDSVTTEQSSGYGSAIAKTGSGRGDRHVEFKSDLEEFRATFGSHPIEVNEEDYVSPMKLSNEVKDDADDDVDSGREDNIHEDDTDKLLRAKIASYAINDIFDVEERLDKARFMLERQGQKREELRERITQLEESRTKVMADIGRMEFREIFRADWDPVAAEAAEKKKGKKDKKSKKKKGKDKGDSPNVVIQEAASDRSLSSQPSSSGTAPSCRGAGAAPLVRSTAPLMSLSDSQRARTDEWVLDRMTSKHVAMAETDPEVCRLSAMKQIAHEKLEASKKQLKELEGEERLLTVLLSRMKENSSSSRFASNEGFRRKQSPLYNMMNQEKPHEIETSNVERLLHQVNSHLISDKECEYVYHVLDLPQRHRIDFKLFTIVAALSEKISRLDPFIKKLITKIDFEALDVKMDRAKALFYLLEDEDEHGFPGEVPVSNLAIELEAGGLRREHVDLVMEKFNRDGKGTVDFLDFLTYIPLFIDLHENIVSDPLYTAKDL